MTNLKKNTQVPQCDKTAFMVSADIKKECELMYSQIKNAESRLKQLREICKHEDTDIGNYSYRIGVVEQTEICNYCGEFALKFPMGITEMTDKTKLFDELHKDCEPTWIEPIADQSKNIEQKAMWWIANGHIGMSSKTMWLHFMGQKIERINHPYDPDDFSRCYKLLEAVPEWKLRILELSKISNAWKNLSENWEKLTQMFEENERNDWKTSKKIGMYEFMQTLI